MFAYKYIVGDSLNPFLKLTPSMNFFVFGPRSWLDSWMHFDAVIVVRVILANVLRGKEGMILTWGFNLEFITLAGIYRNTLIKHSIVPKKSLLND